ncbi:MAG: DHH family phosphoesterase, partial [Calditrichia bacterium]|nr:DHH family phosphoesterase [Calditrichia bacterium]
MKVEKEIIDFLDRENNFLITCHINADGDAYASSLAVAQMLKQMGKKYYLIFPDEEVKHRYNFLPYFNEVIPYSDNLQINDIQAAIICDAPGMRRIGDVEKLLPAFEKRLKIDHHPTENGLAKFNYVDDKASSASKLVYNLIVELGLQFNLELAKTIYTGVSYDTGRFSYANASSEDYHIASQLMKFDIKID